MTRRGTLIVGAFVGIALSAVFWIIWLSRHPSVSDQQAKSVGYSNAADRAVAHRIISGAAIKHRLSDGDFVELTRLIHSNSMQWNSKNGILLSLRGLNQKEQELRVLISVQDLASDQQLRGALVALATDFAVHDPTVITGWTSSNDQALSAIGNEASKAAKDRVWLEQKTSGTPSH